MVRNDNLTRDATVGARDTTVGARDSYDPYSDRVVPPSRESSLDPFFLPRPYVVCRPFVSMSGVTWVGRSIRNGGSTAPCCRWW